MWNQLLVILPYWVSDPNVRHEVKCPYSPKVLFRFFFFLEDTVFLLEYWKHWVKSFCGKVLVCWARMVFLANMRRNMLPPCNRVPGAAAQPSGWFETVSLYVFPKSPSYSHYRMKTNVNLLGHWFLISRSALFTQLVYGSVKWLWQCIAVTDNVQFPTGNSLALSSASLISLPGGWLACFSKRALPRFTSNRINHACIVSTTAPRQPQA